MAAESPISALAGGFASFAGGMGAAIPILLLVIFAAIGFGIYMMLRGGAKKGEACIFIIDPVRRKMGTVKAEEIATGLYRTKEGDIVFVPRNAAAYDFGREKCFPALRYGKLSYIDPDREFRVSLVIDNIESEVGDVSDVISSLYSKGKLKGTMPISPGVEVAFYVDGRKLAEMLTKEEEEDTSDLINALIDLTGVAEEATEYYRSKTEYVKAEAQALEAKIFGIGGVAIAAIMVIGIILYLLSTAR